MLPEEYRKLENYGVSYDIVKTTPSELEANGYTRLPAEIAERATMLYQYAPSEILEHMMKATAENAINEITQDAYRVITKEGMHLAKSKATEGAVRGTLLSNETNQVAGQAEWIKLNAPQDVSAASQYALGFFNVASMVTGQYFMSEINAAMDRIEDSIRSIAEFVEAENMSQIVADEQLLRHVYDNMDCIKSNDRECQATIMEIKSIRRKALANMRLYEKEVQTYRSDVTVEGKAKDILRNAQQVLKYFPVYLCSLDIYSNASFLEVVLSDMTDPAYLDNLVEEIKWEESRYEATSKHCIFQISEVIDSAKSLNYKKSLPGKIAKRLEEIPVGDLKTFAVKLAAFTLNEIENNKSEKHKDELERLLEIMRKSGDLEVIEASINNIEEFNRSSNTPVEMIKCDNAIYIKDYINCIDKMRKA